LHRNNVTVNESYTLPVVYQTSRIDQRHLGASWTSKGVDEA
jgi:hypothetical protein